MLVSKIANEINHTTTSIHYYIIHYYYINIATECIAVLVCIVNIQPASKPLALSLFWLASIVALWLNCVCQRSDPFFVGDFDLLRLNMMVISHHCDWSSWYYTTPVTELNKTVHSCFKREQFPLLTLCAANVLLRPLDALWISQSAVWESCDHDKILFQMVPWPYMQR